ncbi:MAG: hypothetical protein IJT79_09020 [Ruminococcus sp.]|nr:hypothetical protein [Ruminococcus sp.]
MAVIKYFIERRVISVIFSIVRNANGGVSTGCKLALPKKWMDAMELSPDDRQVCVDFDPEYKTIFISKANINDKVILSKKLLKEVGLKTTSNFSIDINKNNKSITLKGDTIL